MNNRLARLVLVGIALTIFTIDAMQTDFTRPGSTDGSVRLRTRDDVVFLVDATLAKKSATIQNLLEDVSIDEEIPLPNVTGVVLSRLLAITDIVAKLDLTVEGYKALMEKRNEALSLKDYVDLLAARNYLDIELVHQLILDRLLDNLTLTVADLKVVLGASPLPHEYKVSIISELSKRADWNGKVVAEFFAHAEVPLMYRRLLISELQKNNPALKAADLVEVLASPVISDVFKKEVVVVFAQRSKKLDIGLAREVYTLAKISLPSRLLMIKELIKNNRALLQEVVGPMAMLYKESRDRGEDPEEGGFYFPEASGEAEEVLLREVERLVVDNYARLIEALEAEYPEIQ